MAGRPLTPERVYQRMSALSGLKVGDDVKIIRTFKDGEMGNRTGAFDDQEAYVGMTGTITNELDGDFEVSVDGDEWYWPFFCLQKVDQEEYEVGDMIPLRPSGREAIVDNDGVHVGCEDISFAAFDKLAQVVAKARNTVLIYGEPGGSRLVTKTVTKKLTKKAAKKVTKKRAYRRRT